MNLNPTRHDASPTNLDLSLARGIWHLTSVSRSFYVNCPLSIWLMLVRTEANTRLYTPGLRWSAHELFTSIYTFIYLNFALQNVIHTLVFVTMLTVIFAVMESCCHVLFPPFVVFILCQLLSETPSANYSFISCLRGP